ncbi:nitronate monooxygenase [Sesbania bispinosa]|nr:nitronate monooxygenase [Sesbania bispinosa]
MGEKWSDRLLFRRAVPGGLHGGHGGFKSEEKERAGHGCEVRVREESGCRANGWVTEFAGRRGCGRDVALT